MNSQQASERIDEAATLHIANLRNAGKDLREMRENARAIQGVSEGGNAEQDK